MIFTSGISFRIFYTSYNESYKYSFLRRKYYVEQENE